MARPRKFPEEVKGEEQVLEKAVEVQEPTPAVELNNIALSVVKNPKTGFWHVVTIPFDVKTGTVGPMEMSKESDERSITLERFKIEAAKRLMGDV